MTNGRRTGHLVDSNVLIYAYDPADPVKQGRAVWILSILQNDRNGAFSTQVLGEFFNSVTRKIPMRLPHAEAEREVTNLARVWPVFDLTTAIVLEAVRGVQRHQFSYWDALIWATAKLNGVANVLSEDFNDGSMLEGVRFLNPFAGHFDFAWLTRR